jgi:hypothetical protein
MVDVKKILSKLRSERADIDRAIAAIKQHGVSLPRQEFSIQEGDSVFLRLSVTIASPPC